MLALAATSWSAAGHSAPVTALPESNLATRAWVKDVYGKLPLSFEANQGQTAADVTFLSRGPGYGLFLTSGGAVLALRKHTPNRQWCG